MWRFWECCSLIFILLTLGTLTRGQGKQLQLLEPIVHVWWKCVYLYILSAAVIETLDSCSARVRINCRDIVTSDRDCEYSAVWHVRGDEIQFTVTANTTGWVAIGFSDTPNMVSLYNYYIALKQFFINSSHLESCVAGSNIDQQIIADAHCTRL